jgi:hypothetical protein
VLRHLDGVVAWTQTPNQWLSGAINELSSAQYVDDRHCLVFTAVQAAAVLGYA